MVTPKIYPPIITPSINANSVLANAVFAGPTSGGNAPAAFRSLVASDLPAFEAMVAAYADNGTNDVYDVLTLQHNTGGTPAAGFGTSILLAAEDTTTEDVSVARVKASWATATHASRKGQLDLTVYDDAGERTGFSVGTNGVVAKIGFFGHAPAARPSAYTPTNVSTDRSYDANATTLDEIADVLGTLIADLQAYGLLA